MKDHNNLKEITRSLLKEIGEDPNRDGLLKTPERVAKAWDFFSQGYDTDIGLSKIPRIVDAFAQRLQVQERLTGQVAETLMDILDPKGVGVVMEGRHLCMQMRGVEKQNSFATTSAMLGQFRDSAETRSEFLSIIRMKQF